VYTVTESERLACDPQAIRKLFDFAGGVVVARQYDQHAPREKSNESRAGATKGAAKNARAIKMIASPMGNQW